MARIRSVHPGIFTDEAFVSVSRDGRLLFIGLLCEADDRGVFEWKPLTLKMRLFAADTVDVAVLLFDLEHVGMVRQFETDGRRFGAIRNFCRYQRPKAPKVIYPLPEALHSFVAASGKAEPGTPLSYPVDVTAAARKRRQRETERAEGSALAVCHGSDVTDRSMEREEAPGHGGNSHVSAVTTSVMSRQMEEEGGNRKKDTHGASAPIEPAAPDPFEVFWQIYPKREGANPKKPAREKFAAAVRRGADPEVMIAAARRLAAQHPKPTSYIPQAATWLHQERYADDGATGAVVPITAVPEAKWRQRLDHGRRRHDWACQEWGPMPNTPGCRVPAHLVEPGDGDGWVPQREAA